MPKTANATPHWREEGPRRALTAATTAMHEAAKALRAATGGEDGLELECAILALHAEPKHGDLLRHVYELCGRAMRQDLDHDTLISPELVVLRTAIFNVLLDISEVRDHADD
jgi:hypothetical protein